MGVRDVLSAPWVFDTYQSLIGAPSCHRRYVDNYVVPKPGDRVIDFGCGLGVALKYLPKDLDYLGVDFHAPYIQEAKKRYPTRAFVNADIETLDVEPYGKFDVGISFGVVHHLSDRTAEALGRQAKAAIKQGGRLVCIDPVYVPAMPQVAKFLIDHDRGSFPRNEGAYRNIFEAFGTVKTEVVTDMLRVPYTMVITSVTFS